MTEGGDHSAAYSRASDASPRLFETPCWTGYRASTI